MEITDIRIDRRECFSSVQIRHPLGEPDRASVWMRDQHLNLYAIDFDAETSPALLRKIADAIEAAVKAKARNTSAPNSPAV